MLISIIIPVYNVEKYIKRCLDSLFQQINDDVEVIIVDDGSTDSSLSICNEYKNELLNFKVLSKPNGGLSDARNFGLSKSSGDYVLFLDSDDYIDKDTIEKFKPYLDSDNDIIIGDCLVENSTKRYQHIQRSFSGTGEDFLYISLRNERMPMMAWLNIYRRKFLIDNDLKFKVGIYHEDEEFTPRAFLKAKQVSYQGICFYHYVIREGSITTKKDKKKNLVDFLYTSTALEKLFKNTSSKKTYNEMRNALADKYLNMFPECGDFKYEKKYLRRSFVLKNSKKLKTLIKALVFVISPRLYSFLRNNHD